jgi:lysine-N-methylase
MASIRNLPLIQNWDCHQCGSCCTDYWVPVSDEERARIQAQAWENEPEFKGVKLFIPYSWPWRRKYRLAQTKGDRCIFLSDQGLCKIHAKFGLEAKPFACRLYPYILVPHGDHWRVSMRFACPSAAANKGRSLEASRDELHALALEMEKWDEKPGYRRAPGPGLSDPPRLAPGQKLSWNDVHFFQNALLIILKDSQSSLPRRMLKLLALARLCQPARFDQVSGGRLREFLDVVLTAVDAEVPRNLDRLRPPGWIGRILFRQTLALYIRKDQGVRRGISKEGRIALMRAMWRMVQGTGMLPRLQVGLPEKDFAEFEEPLGPLPPAAVEALERYYQIKTESLQFCGPTYYDFSFWEGVEALTLTLPMIQWLTRGYRELGQPEATYKAISVIDENFGYNPLLGKPRQRMSLWILNFRRELDRLIAWYGR